MDKNDGTPGLPLGVAVVEPVRAVHFGECDVTHLAVGTSLCLDPWPLPIALLLFRLSSINQITRHAARFFPSFFFFLGARGTGPIAASVTMPLFVSDFRSF